MSHKDSIRKWVDLDNPENGQMALVFVDENASGTIMVQ